MIMKLTYSTNDQSHSDQNNVIYTLTEKPPEESPSVTRSIRNKFGSLRSSKKKSMLTHYCKVLE